jgi:hypothetical protein
MCALTLAAIVQAQASDLDAVVKRLGAYTSGYAERFATVIAEEHYNQRTESTRSSPGGPSSSRSGDRTIRSDYALTRVNGEWIAYRDAYEVDGVKVRDRNDRLGRLLSNSGSPEDLSAILNDNARFNLENARISRNINVPTLVVQLLAPRNLDRFVFTRHGEETVDRRRLWRIGFQERTLPTLIRRATNEDQPVRGTILLDPLSGEIWSTDLTWAKGPGGNIVVTYGRVPDIDVLVPIRMLERYVDGSTEIRGDARYMNFRQFRTSGRLLPAPVAPDTGPGNP